MFKHNKKEVHQRNNIARWAIILSIISFIILCLLIVSIDFTFLKSFIQLKEDGFRFSLILLSGIGCIILIRFIVTKLSRQLNASYLKRFTHLPDFALYEETIWQKFFPKRKTAKYKHAVLIFHGFAASIQEFQYLLPELKKNNIPYLAPNIPGFGRHRVSVLANVDYQDWLRSAIYHYEILSELADNISIIGHSMGSLLATYVAKHKPVENLILSGPAMYVVDRDIKLKKFLTLKYLSDIYIWLFPYFPKPIRKDRKSCADMMDESHLHQIFQYISCPTRAVKQLALLQNHINILDANYQHLFLIYGQYETTVNINRLLKTLDENHMAYTHKCYPNSAHSAYEDLDHQQAINDTIKQLLLHSH